MYCIKCGEDNLEKAKFCRKCGEPFEAEEETRVAVRQPDFKAYGEASPATGDDSERQVFTISPTLLFVKIGYVLAAVGALLLVAIFSTFASSIPIWISVLLGLALFLIPAFYHFKQKLVRYTLTDSKLEIDSGFISRSTRNIPIRRIQDVTVSTSVLQRILGFGSLVIDNASEEGGKVVLRNINTPKRYADELLSEMRRLEK